ncbi:hypothetical protein EXS62_02175 [Candidatus Kaiserbacteria bacterium]|nr:hypothetical protein [Candidatus Kaiserbacteria bacterium]
MLQRAVAYAKEEASWQLLMLMRIVLWLPRVFCLLSDERLTPPRPLMDGVIWTALMTLLGSFIGLLVASQQIATEQNSSWGIAVGVAGYMFLGVLFVGLTLTRRFEDHIIYAAVFVLIALWPASYSIGLAKYIRGTFLGKLPVVGALMR